MLYRSNDDLLITVYVRLPYLQFCDHRGIGTRWSTFTSWLNIRCKLHIWTRHLNFHFSSFCFLLDNISSIINMSIIQYVNICSSRLSDVGYCRVWILFTKNSLFQSYFMNTWTSHILDHTIYKKNFVYAKINDRVTNMYWTIQL